MKNQGQVLTNGQVSQVAKRLFRAIDQEERKNLNKEQAVEFISFMKEHMFHSSYKESRDKPKVEALFDQLPGTNYEVKLPNPDYPEYPIIIQEKRVAFKPIYESVYAEAKNDGCIWIPFEETTPKPKQSYAEKAEEAE